MASSIHFSDRELSCRGTKCGPEGTGCHVNACTQTLVDTLEAIRVEACRIAGTDMPVIVDDAYRCPAHNSTTPNAAKSSQHLSGRAADIRIQGWTSAQLERLVESVAGVHGIGRASAQDYVHIDVRPAPLRRWCYDQRGAVVAYYSPDPPAGGAGSGTASG